VHGIEQIDARSASAALDMYEVDKRGLDRLDRSVLEALITKFGGGPVGLSTLAIAVGEEPETVETVAEPYLVREGLLGRTPRGRIAMAPAWTHLGLAVPDGVFGQDTLDLFGPDTEDEESATDWISNSQ
jgi:Holliday junction DNA helicase RuvB